MLLLSAIEAWKKKRGFLVTRSKGTIEVVLFKRGKRRI